jgi:hypothetical protein
LTAASTAPGNGRSRRPPPALQSALDLGRVDADRGARAAKLVGGQLAASDLPQDRAAAQPKPGCNLLRPQESAFRANRRQCKHHDTCRTGRQIHSETKAMQTLQSAQATLLAAMARRRAARRQRSDRAPIPGGSPEGARITVRLTAAVGRSVTIPGSTHTRHGCGAVPRFAAPSLSIQILAPAEPCAGPVNSPKRSLFRRSWHAKGAGAIRTHFPLTPSRLSSSL